MNLPDKYAWLNDEPGPKMLKEALALYGTLETPGAENNPVIMAWAKEVGVNGWYPGDATPWCGLFQGVIAKRAGWDISKDLLAAASWALWGTRVEPGNEMLGDVLVFSRTGGHHVAEYIGESKDNFLIYGGNQGDKVGFEWIGKNRCIARRRAPWRVSQPASVRKIYLDDNGAVLAHNEA